MTKDEFVELSATLAGYALEESCDEYPYMTQANGDVTYTEEAQEEYNRHYATVQDILGAYFDVGQHCTDEEETAA